MKPIHDASWCIMIDITNLCFLSCLYCSRYNKHLRKDQRASMSLEQIDAALESLRGWPTMIGIIGGEPLLHPQFEEVCKMVQSKYPREKMAILTSGGPKWDRYRNLVHQTFAVVAYNEHSPEQLKVCKHQPLTVAIKDAVPDPELRAQLIDDCWVQRTWCATINHKGAYFCEIAAAQDVIMDGENNAWKVEPNWWVKTPDQFQDQVCKFCDNCGMAIPMERDLIKNKSEKMSPSIIEMFKAHGLSKMTNEDVEVFTTQFTKEDILKYIKTWAPGNYRQDIHEDDKAPEGLGFTKTLK